MVTNECHLVSEQSNKQVFILSRDRSRNYSTYTLTLCILNAELWVTTPVEPVLCGQLSGMFHLDICSDLLTVGVYAMPLQRKVNTFIFCRVMYFPNQFFYSWLFIWVVAEPWMVDMCKMCFHMKYCWYDPQLIVFFASCFCKALFFWLFAQPKEAGNGSIKDLTFLLVKGREKMRYT